MAGVAGSCRLIKGEGGGEHALNIYASPNTLSNKKTQDFVMNMLAKAPVNVHILQERETPVLEAVCVQDESIVKSTPVISDASLHGVAGDLNFAEVLNETNYNAFSNHGVGEQVHVDAHADTCDFVSRRGNGCFGSLGRRIDEVSTQLRERLQNSCVRICEIVNGYIPVED